MARTITGIVKNQYDTAANLTASNPTPLAGQIVIESDTNKMKVGDGTTAWNSLDYAIGGDVTISDITGLQDELDDKLESPIAISDVTDLQDALDDKLESPIAISDVTDLQDSLDAAGPERAVYLSNYSDMQEAIDDLATDGGILYIDTDTDLTANAPIELKSNVHLIGIGNPSIACSSASYMFEAEEVSNIRVENLTLTGFQQNPSNGYFRFYNIAKDKSNLVFKNISMSNSDEIAFSLVNGKEIILENVTTNTTEDYGINLEQCERVQLLNCKTDSSTVYGLRMLNCHHSTVVNFESAYDNIGIYLDTNTQNNMFVSCSVRESTGHAIQDSGDWNTWIACKTTNTGGTYSVNDQNGTGIIWINCDWDADVYSYTPAGTVPDSNVVLLSEAAQYFNDFGQNILTQLHSGESIELTNPVDGSGITEPGGLEPPG